MTLILGLNLQEHVYLASDTRLSLKNGTHRDNFLKWHAFGKDKHCVVAGSANIASWLIQRLRDKGFDKLHYKDFIEKVDEFFHEQLPKYPGIEVPNNTVFIFGGRDERFKKEINMKKLHEITGNQGATASKPIQQRIHPSFVKDMINKALNRMTGEYIISDVISYSGLASVEIIFSPSGFDIKKNIAEWGEYLMFGPNGLRKDSLPFKVYEALDLLPRPRTESKTDRIARNTAIIAGTILTDLVPAHQLNSVGGTIVVTEINEDGNTFMDGDLYMVRPDGDGTPECVCGLKIDADRNFCVKIGDQYQKMDKVADYFRSLNDENEAKI